jgi:hypothetical protein
MTENSVSPVDVEAAIAGEFYFTAADGVAGAAMVIENGQCVVPAHRCSPDLRRVTFCCLVLKNGYVVTGESACASIANFDAEKGRKYARLAAVDKIWPLLGYAMRDALFQAGVG